MLDHPPEEAHQSIDVTNISTQSSLQASTALSGLRWRRIDSVHGHATFHPFDAISLRQAAQASLQAHAVLDGLYTPSGALVDALPPAANHDSVGATSSLRSVELLRAGPTAQAPLFDHGTKPTYPVSTETIPQVNAHDDQNVRRYTLKNNSAIPQVCPATRVRRFYHVPPSSGPAEHDPGATASETINDSAQEGLPLRHHCGGPGCQGYRSAEGPNWLQSIRAHYKNKHPDVKFSQDRLIATRCNRRSRAMTPISKVE